MYKKEIDLNEELLGYNKAILVFNRDDGSNDFEKAINAYDAFECIANIDKDCRNFLKYRAHTCDLDSALEFIDSIRSLIREEDKLLPFLNI